MKKPMSSVRLAALMATLLMCADVVVAASKDANAMAIPAGVTLKDVQFYSEAVLCAGQLFLPSGYSTSSKLPAVVLAPGLNQTQTGIAQYAAQLAASGMVAMTMDYRGWGKSGGFLYIGETVRADDRMRFTPMTAKMRIRRLRVDPRSQVIDIRNAITYLQGEAGVDRARIGVWGHGLAGDHAVVIAGSDARVKAIVAQTPTLAGSQTPRTAFKPTAEQQATLVKLARDGAAPATEKAAKNMNAAESKVALADYHPFWYLEHIAQTTAVLFVVAESETKSNDNAKAAAKVVKGATQLISIPGTTSMFKGKQAETASGAAAEWFGKYL